MKQQKAEKLVADERRRVESEPADADGDITAAGLLQTQQTGEAADSGSTLETETLAVARAADLRQDLGAVRRAEDRLAGQTYGRSVESGSRIPDARLEVAPLAERTVEEQRRSEEHEHRHS